MIKELTATSISLINHYINLEKKGSLSKIEAQKLAAEHIQEIRYGADNKDYFWITDNLISISIDNLIYLSDIISTIVRSSQLTEGSISSCINSVVPRINRLVKQIAISILFPLIVLQLFD